MPTPDLTPADVDALVDTRDLRTGLRYPPPGLQPYHRWLVDTLHRLADHSAADLRVDLDDASPTTIRVAPGRASISSTPLVHEGSTHDLAAFNNDTAYVWLENDGSDAANIAFDSDATGWPATAHLKLAEVALAGGAVTHVLDRRFETLLAV